MGLEEDVLPGEQLVVCLLPFLQHLVLSSLSPKTIRRHVDNLWLLGGEIIRDLHNDPTLRKLSAHRLLPNAIHEGGGLAAVRSFTTAPKTSSVPSTPPAANSTASSIKLQPDLQFTHRFPGRTLLFRVY